MQFNAGIHYLQLTLHVVGGIINNKIVSKFNKNIFPMPVATVYLKIKTFNHSLVSENILISNTFVLFKSLLLTLLRQHNRLL